MTTQIIYTQGGPAVWTQPIRQPVHYQQPIAIVSQPRPSISVDDSFESSASKGLGIAQIVCGILGFILGILMIVSCSYNGSAGNGIWCSFFLFVCGSISICAAKEKSRGLIIASLVFSILLCVIFSFAMFVTGAVALAFDNGTYYWFLYRSGCGGNSRETAVAWDALLMVAGLFSWICALAQSIICCKSKAICGGNTVGPTVVYHSQPMYANPGMPGYSQHGYPGFAHPGYHPAQVPKPPDYSQLPPQPAPPPAYSAPPPTNM